MIKTTELSNKNLYGFHIIFKLSDSEPDINYKYLLFLKEIDTNKFNKYIRKYLYTLNYKEAKIIYSNLITQEE